jgi:hypothetical protein
MNIGNGQDRIPMLEQVYVRPWHGGTDAGGAPARYNSTLP